MSQEITRTLTELEEDEDELEPFAPVLAELQLDQVPALAASLWERQNTGSNLAPQPTLGVLGAQ
jgi:hypothetical protein